MKHSKRAVKDKEIGIAQEKELARVIFQAMARHAKTGFCSDEIWEIVRNETDLSPAWVARYIGPTIRSFHQRKYLVKTKEFRTSNRQGNSALPIYKVALPFILDVEELKAAQAKESN